MTEDAQWYRTILADLAEGADYGTPSCRQDPGVIVTRRRTHWALETRTGTRPTYATDAARFLAGEISFDEVREALPCSCHFLDDIPGLKLVCGESDCPVHGLSEGGEEREVAAPGPKPDLETACALTIADLKRLAHHWSSLAPSHSLAFEQLASRLETALGHTIRPATHP